MPSNADSSTQNIAMIICLRTFDIGNIYVICDCAIRDAAQALYSPHFPESLDCTAVRRLLRASLVLLTPGSSAVDADGRADIGLRGAERL